MLFILCQHTQMLRNVHIRALLQSNICLCHSSSQAVNFALVPPLARTVFLGGIALTFTIFLCHLKNQRGHKLE